ncbi:MAG: GH116 family glycosyl hydrolase, partial [Armatimonadota bacterium]|nr:GH116 family glycosyl hydrolase [Armatimonadota bacterium]
SKDSGIPGIFFVFKVKNEQMTNVSASICASLQNAVNYDGRSDIKGVRFAGYGGNENKLIEDRNFTALHMSNPSVSNSERQFGTMTLGTLGKASAMIQWDIPEEMWADFAADGKFDRVGPLGPSRKGRTWNGALAVSVALKPEEEKSVVFFIAWHFPNYYVEYDRAHENDRLGRMYNNWFKDSLAVAKYLAQNYERLSKETHLFRDTFYNSSLPYWLLDRISSQASTLTSQVCMWIEDGSFHGYEGAGCCPMNCTHVWNYEQTLAYLFPDLERNMRHTDLTVQQEPSGAVRHRTVLPLTAPRETGPFVDGQLGTVLKSYREYRLSADRKWLDEMWQRIKLAMDYVISEWDPNADGVLVNEQWNTYDAAMYGPNTFIGTLYLGALRAAEEMAKVVGDKDSARYRALFEMGSKRLDQVLWNGEYYVHIDSKEKAAAIKDAAWIIEDWPNENSSANRPYGAGCHADQLFGQWWANILDLGYLLPKERICVALDSILKYDWRWDFGEVPQQRAFAGSGDMGLLNCTWPYGGRPSQAILYADEVWTGIEYEVAGLLVREGRIEDAYRIVKAVSDR